MLHACMKLYRTLAMNQTTEDGEQERLSHPNHVSITMTSGNIENRSNGGVGYNIIHLYVITEWVTCDMVQLSSTDPFSFPMRQFECHRQ